MLSYPPVYSAQVAVWQLIPDNQTRHAHFALQITNIKAYQLPQIGQPIDLEISVSSTRPEPNIRLELFVPDGMVLRKGNSFWIDSLQANEVKNYQITVEVIQPGEHVLTASLYGEEHPSDALDGVSLYFQTNEAQTPITPSYLYKPKQETAEGEVSTEYLNAAIPPGMIQLKGNVTYEAKSGDCFQVSHCITLKSGLVLERAKLELWDKEGVSQRLLAEGYLSNTGSYDFVVSNKDTDGTAIDPVIKILSTDNSRVKIVDAESSDALYAIIFPLGQNLPDGVYNSLLNFKDTTPSGEFNDFNQALFIFDTLANNSYNFLDKQANWTNPDMVQVNWPYSCVYDLVANSCYFNEEIYLFRDDGTQPDVIIHEYGHFVLSRFAGNSQVILACAPGFTHSLSEPSSPSCAWSEGWANFLQAVVQNDPDYRGFSFETPTINPSPTQAVGVYWEIFVTATLWDIYDSTNEPFDTFSAGFNSPNGLWHMATNIITSDFTRAIPQFFDGWIPSPGQTGLCPLMTQHFFFSRLTLSSQPASGGVISSPNGDCLPFQYLGARDVILSAISVSGYSFNRWGGDLAGWVTIVPHQIKTSAKYQHQNIQALFFTIEPTPTPINPIQIEKRINHSQNDAGWGYSNGMPCSYATNHREIYFGNCNGVPAWAGFRFTELNVPHNANIIDAYIVFTVDGPYSNLVQVKFYGENTGFATPFDSSPIGNRPLTTNSATWSISGTWSLGQQRNSPSLKNIVQEIVNRPDWASGGAMAFLVEDNGTAANTHRRVVGYDRLFNPPGPQNAAKLVIIYQ